MQTNEMARKLSHDFKLTARTAPEIYEVVNHLVLRAAADGVKFRRRKMGVEAALNAVLLDFLDRPEGEQLAILATNVRRFESMMEDEGKKPSKGARAYLSNHEIREGLTETEPPTVNHTKVITDPKGGKRKSSG